jgi:hypothetical protein
MFSNNTDECVVLILTSIELLDKMKDLVVVACNIELRRGRKTIVQYFSSSEFFFHEHDDMQMINNHPLPNFSFILATIYEANLRKKLSIFIAKVDFKQ